MIEIAPSYYKKFSCIADKCKHNCCIGWEIDVDEETLVKYNALSTPLGERIRNNIEGNPPHFVLGENERCPFLNKSNLCDIISEKGETYLCEICKLHPRFRNFYTDFYETGLGLCCEEAVRIILSETDKFSIVSPENVKISDEERAFFEERTHIFAVLQNRNKTILSRFRKLATEYGFEFNFDLCDVKARMLSLERLDDVWTNELEKISDKSFDKSVFENEIFSVALEQLSVYFIFRHLPLTLEFMTYSECVKFALVSCFVIGVLWQSNNCVSLDEKALDLVRMFSSEVEYSEENTEMLMCF